MLDAAMTAPEISWVTGGAAGEDVVQLKPGKLSDGFRLAFRGARRGRIIGVRLLLVGDAAGDPAAGLIPLHVTTRRRIDRFTMWALETAVGQFPRVVQAVTARFAQAEVMEQLLEETRIKDDLLRLLLASFQHDLGNAHASLQA
jgi:hypothetical protein